MPRPRKAGLDYFPEDVDRRNDFKIMDLLNEYGPLGYTIYDFCLQYNGLVSFRREAWEEFLSAYRRLKNEFEKEEYFLI